jgi:ribosomal-protein-serine acetyltransferase
MFSYKIDDETEIRLLEQRHAEEMLALTEKNRERLREWFSWLDDTRTVQDLRAFIRESLMVFASDEGFYAGIWHQGRLVGCIDCMTIDRVNHKVAIGYWLGAEFEGKGLVTRAARALVDWLFQEAGLKRVEIHCATGNRKSRAIAERLGFREEGTHNQSAWLYDHYVDMVIYAMLKEEWSAIRDEWV